MKELYCAIDLHSNNGFYEIVEKSGKRVFGKRIPNDLSKVLEVLEPFKTKINQIAVESTYNWYWLVDGLKKNGFDVQLANPAAMEQYSGLKNTDNKTDAFFAVNKKVNMVTSNHVHLLLTAKNGSSISEDLRYLHGRVGQWYNKQVESSGSFWSDRFHSTLIQDGEHFGKCLFYIDMNMLRAGAVKHPSEWDACAYHEFYKPKSKFRIVNIVRLCQVLAIENIEEFRKWHTLTIDNILQKKVNMVACHNAIKNIYSVPLLHFKQMSQVKLSVLLISE